MPLSWAILPVCLCEGCASLSEVFRNPLIVLLQGDESDKGD